MSVSENSRNEKLPMYGPVRVMYLDSAVSMAGGQRSLLRVLRKIDKRFIEPIVFSPGHSELSKHCRSIGIECYHLPFSSSHKNRVNRIIAKLGDFTGMLYGVFYLSAKARKLDIDLIHANTFKCALVGVLSSFLARKPLIYHDRALKRHGVLDRVVSWAAARIITVSDCVAHKYPSGIRPKIRVCYGAVCQRDAAVFSDASSYRTIGYLGRISEEKGLDLLIRCLPLVVDKIEGVRLLVAGSTFSPEDSVYLERINDLIREMKVEKSVELLGKTEDIEKFFARIAVLALPSRRDAMPNVVLEAMSMGVPVVAFKSGGAQEVIIDGETGFLVDCFDINAFGECLIKLLREPELARAMGQRGREWVIKNRSLDSTVQSIESCYKEVIVG